MSTVFYRYVNQEERDFIEREGMIKSRSSRGTFFTTRRYDTSAKAQKDLALERPPKYRIGPIPGDEMPEFDKRSLQPVGVSGSQPGGGLEGATAHAVYLFAVTPLS